MIVPDTCIWVDFLRQGDAGLARLLNARNIASHPFILGEVAMGSLRDRAGVLSLLAGLPQVDVATDEEVLDLVEQHKFFSQGVGYIDAHLLAALKLSPGTRLWTRDARLAKLATALGLLYREPTS